MIVVELGCQGLFSCVFSQGLMRFKNEIIEKMRNHHVSKDIDRMLNSKSNPRYRKICSFNATKPEDYLQFNALNSNKLRAASQVALIVLTNARGDHHLVPLGLQGKWSRWSGLDHVLPSMTVGCPLNKLPTAGSPLPTFKLWVTRTNGIQAQTIFRNTFYEITN
ncbi:unnamed protein product [Nezara viridula]|uniref:Uncharacterized protein n=1 Tax=Nezara viridula TaxID=85310 RepID=A0A9P0E868_NEZVI|nr:unnamed protein product [Nezara viridula]